MFFYCIDAYGYEESYQNIYMSNKEYSQEEFEEIVFKTYEKFCYKIVEKEENSPCFCNIFFGIEFSVFSDLFDKLLLEDYELENIKPTRITAGVTFDLTDNPNKPNTDRVYDILLGLDLDTSCSEDCKRLKGEDIDDDFKRDCLITKILENKRKESV